MLSWVMSRLALLRTVLHIGCTTAQTYITRICYGYAELDFDDPVKTITCHAAMLVPACPAAG
jgi:hypothetical protein